MLLLVRGRVARSAVLRRHDIMNLSWASSGPLGGTVPCVSCDLCCPTCDTSAAYDEWHSLGEAEKNQRPFVAQTVARRCDGRRAPGKLRLRGLFRGAPAAVRGRGAAGSEPACNPDW